MGKRKSKEADERIPKGSCCYKITKGPDFDEDDTAHFKAECCPYYVHQEGIEGHCVKLQEPILDAVKLCNFPEEEDDY